MNNDIVVVNLQLENDNLKKDIMTRDNVIRNLEEDMDKLRNIITNLEKKMKKLVEDEKNEKKSLEVSYLNSLSKYIFG
jgi:hemerythrin-like domain-containing protein